MYLKKKKEAEIPPNFDQVWKKQQFYPKKLQLLMTITFS